ncbi:carbohydrate-binding protein [Micromonospora sp. WMMD1082]|uniref:carbohydrate-binding protein n=1 Tax=Micromonospora sp. WMMD1082 TaxID=3016104 RepID=UPI002415D6CE|nr:carbohydrate-binding protein [Micromonospora sp. WMMD1082]MDG4797544.1 carbohydrate-binding protein [Micromonospora sp. WMMD1082]
MAVRRPSGPTPRSRFALVAAAVATVVAGSLTQVPVSTSAASKADSVVVSVKQPRQTIRGFGGMTHTAWIGDLTPSQRDTAFDNGPDDLGLSILRIPVPEDRADWSNDLATAQAASAKGALVIAAPWNPPADLVETFEKAPVLIGSVYEAEDGALVDAVTATSAPGFDGTGYVDFTAAAGASVQWDNVVIGSAGLKTFGFRYALASGTRTLDLYVNDELVAGDVEFEATGSESTWDMKLVHVQMTPGMNVVRLETTGDGGPSLDNLTAAPYSDATQAMRVAHDKYAEYAQHLNDFVEYLRANGVELYGISVQNEPDYAFEWTWWTPEEIVRFLRDYAGVISTRVIAPESFQYRKEMSDPILNDPGALANLDILGAHLYGTQYADFRYPLFEEKGAGKELWMTEIYTPNSETDSAQRWPEALQVAEHIHHSMADAQFQAYVWWYIRRNYGPILEDGTISKRGYMLAHYTKFVRPGDVRVEATREARPGVLTSAYRGADGTVTVVAVNTNTTALKQRIHLVGTSVSGIDSWVTDATRNLAEVPDPRVTGNHFTASLPAQSVTTFVLQTRLRHGNPR